MSYSPGAALKPMGSRPLLTCFPKCVPFMTKFHDTDIISAYARRSQLRASLSSILHPPCKGCYPFRRLLLMLHALDRVQSFAVYHSECVCLPCCSSSLLSTCWSRVITGTQTAVPPSVIRCAWIRPNQIVCVQWLTDHSLVQ